VQPCYFRVFVCGFFPHASSAFPPPPPLGLTAYSGTKKSSLLEVTLACLIWAGPDDFFPFPSYSFFFFFGRSFPCLFLLVSRFLRSATGPALHAHVGTRPNYFNCETSSLVFTSSSSAAQLPSMRPPLGAFSPTLINGTACRAVFVRF